MWNWLRELYEIKRENKYCASCETLKMQLAIANEEKKKLLDTIISKPEPVKEEEPKEFKPIQPIVNWNVRRQMLEAEDREKARILKQNSIEKLEKELLSAPKTGTESSD